MALEYLYSFLLRPRNGGFLPAARPPTVPVLDQQVCGMDLPLWFSGVLSHVCFEFVHIGTLGWLPSRLFA